MVSAAHDHAEMTENASVGGGRVEAFPDQGEQGTKGTKATKKTKKTTFKR